ncbi:hypothetical protein [Nitrososphaera sp.]|uniref:hypothetical protein n=1 Tax=Nitrososphaera sp. TaxID=1971748 RepID=UPI0017C8A68A|nr:hypothetical protein [Nitrososphaera sp.]NWG36300.1 hypothetical protein [Nitrososphaera sp.]
MGSDGSKFDVSDRLTADRLNRKTVLVETGANIAGVAATPGMLAFCTSSGSGFSTGVLYRRNAANSAWEQIIDEASIQTLTNKIVFGPEAGEESTTPVTDNGQTTVRNDIRHYAFFTLPTTYKFYKITGIEWKNGVTVAGNVQCGVDLVDANPPTIANVINVALGAATAQSGTSSVQRVSMVRSDMIRGGTILGAWFLPDNGVGAFRRQSGLANQNQEKSFTYTITPAIQDATAWATNTDHYYIKVYYRGYN